MPNVEEPKSDDDLIADLRLAIERLEKGSELRKVVIAQLEASLSIKELGRFSEDARRRLAALSSEKVTAQNPLGPPRPLETFIWLMLPRKHRDGILGDAEEAYWQTIERYGSRRIATLDYCKEAIAAILFALQQGGANWFGGAAVKLREIFRKSSS